VTERAARPRPAGARLATGAFRRWLAFWAAFLLLCFTVANVAAIYTRITRNDAAVNPIVFAGVAALVAVCSRRVAAENLYFASANLFVAALTLIGGLTAPEGGDTYPKAQMMGKLWLASVGVPFLAVQAVPRHERPRVISALCTLVAAGGGLAAFQVLSPDTFADIVAESGRGAGVWINPNNCGFICATAYLLVDLFPSGHRVSDLVRKSLLVTGLLASMSRGSLLSFALALLVQLLVARRLKTALRLAVVFVAVVLVARFAMPELGRSSDQADRAASIALAAGGEFEESSRMDTRTDVWNVALTAIGDDWIFGLGLGSMDFIVPGGARGLSPHNFYIYVLGTAGLIPMVLLLAWLWRLARVAMECDKVHRPVAAGLVVLYAVAIFFDSSLPIHQFTSLLFVGLALRAGGRAPVAGRSRPGGVPVHTAMEAA